MQEANFDYMKLLDVPQVEGIETLPLDDFVKMKWINDDLKAVWRKNYAINRLQMNVSQKRQLSKCCILVGSSPAIKKQKKELKKARLNDHFIIIASNGAYGWLLDNDIEPDFVMLIEGRYHVVRDVKRQSGATLVVSPFVDPAVYDTWKGRIETFPCGGGEGFNDLIKKDLDEIDVAGGNVINCAFLWSYKYLGCRDYISIGMSLCYYDSYYVDDRSTEHISADLDHIKAVDMTGNIVNTTAPLLLYKTWLETYSRYSGANFVNCTEDGILGVYPETTKIENGVVSGRVKYLPWMSIAPLNLAIEAYNNKLGDHKNDTRN